MSRSTLLDCLFPLNQPPTQPFISLASSLTFDTTVTTPHLINDVLDPRLFNTSPAMRSTKKKYKEDVLTYNEAMMASPFQDEFYHAMREELHTLANIFKC